MSDALAWALLALVAIAIVLLAVILVRSGKGSQGGVLGDELRAGREEAGRAARENRDELQRNLVAGNETLTNTLKGMAEVQRTQLEGVAQQLQALSESNRTSLDKVSTTVDQRIKLLQDGNEKKLEEMRKTVDEKLQDTLQKRLGESFALVSKQLESVQRGLGEMQSLSTGVDDLKRVLTNVKARGTWAEVQLEALLDQMLAPSQYEKNVHTKQGSAEMVEFAVKLPGAKDDPEAFVWLPIDSKFPQEDYLRIQEAAERGDPEATQKAAEALGRAVKLAAKTIHDKYVEPPQTTDFAVLFLGTEGLYAEVLRQPGLADDLQQTYRIMVAGPTTLAALLSSLRMGFQTLAIEQQAAEVWKILGAIKNEFGKFGAVLDKVKRQLNTAANTIDETGRRTRAMERKLRAVEQLTDEESVALLGAPDVESNGEAEEVELVEAAVVEAGEAQGGLDVDAPSEETQESDETEGDDTASEELTPGSGL
jgi:DNA recombination protein RmuC